MAISKRSAALQRDGTVPRDGKALRDDTAPRTGTEHPARDRLYEQARGVTHDIREMGGLASAAAEEQLGQMGDAASACYGQGRDKVCEVERSVEQYVREQPLTSLLIAVGVGALAGSIGVLCGRLWMRR